MDKSVTKKLPYYLDVKKAGLVPQILPVKMSAAEKIRKYCLCMKNLIKKIESIRIMW